MPNISDLFTSIPGLKADYKTDWIENSKADWKIDWDNVAGGAAGAAPVNTVLPTITGTNQVGQTLTVTTGTWTGNPTPALSYQWRVNGADVVGQTGTTYVVQAGDVGLIVECKVTGTNSQGTSFVMPSAGAAIA